jgi:hypothetical protein
MKQEPHINESQPVTTTESAARSKILINWKRLINWLAFSVGLSLLPLLFTWLFRALVRKETIEVNNDYPEVLFFSVVICATTVADIRGIKQNKRWENYFFLLEALLILGAVFSAVYYGGMRIISILDPSMPLRAQLLRYSIYSTIILGAFSATAQVMLATVEGQNE